MRIAVIIVNYGTAELALGAVESVLADDGPGESPEIHLVDNASPGNDAEVIRRALDDRGLAGRVAFRAETENHGFGRGNNLVLEDLAARSEPPDYVFLLNPDARVEPGAISRLAAALQADPGAAAAGARMALPDGTPLPGAFRFPSFSGEVLHKINFGPIERLFAPRSVALPPDHPGGVVDWVTGAAVMFRMAALRQVGLFDPGFFLYYEEVELMHRLSRAGWHVLHVPEARVIHDAGAATGVSREMQMEEYRRKPAYLYQSWRHYHELTAGRGRALATALAMVPAAGLHVAISTLRRRPPRLDRGFFRDHWTHAVRPLLKGGRS